MDKIAIQAKVNGAWQPADFRSYGDDIPSALGQMDGAEVIIKWEQAGEDPRYYVGTAPLAKSYRVKTKHVLTITQLLKIYHRRKR